MKSLYIHMGLHRTGTTTLQRLLKTQREKLEENGVSLVLRSDMCAHENLDMRRFYASRWWRSKKTGPVVDGLDALGGNSVIVSEEGLPGIMPGIRSMRAYPTVDVFAKKIAEFSPRFDVQPRLMLRRQDKFIESVYAFRVSRGMNMSFRDFVKKVPTADLDWRRFTKTFEKVGLKNSEFYVLEDLQGEGFAGKLIEMVGLKDVLETPARLPKGNGRQSVEALKLALALNKAELLTVSDDRKQFVYRKFEKKRALTAEECLYELPINPIEKDRVRSLMEEETSFEFTDEERMKFLAKYETANSELLAHDFVKADADIWLEN
ncbi:hypothetical protein KFE96_04610 [Kordiimonas sp. SCSIO 12603]|uniref:hypothetical protein n=1 Tax=Kordiimonas sp. SCSIO 12603 TaxID=2829596 RepID=UPI002105EFBD|nr:hypothetical protein [Kordiimonas sp. SCSIO 12603]UTW59593.1 hypothetical protein KFE96_04610 [Kordiimonas sp. SCSIO 12603]